MRPALARLYRQTIGLTATMLLFAGIAMGVFLSARPASAAVVSTDIELLLLASPVSLPAGGGDVTFTYLVKNVGSRQVSDVAVSNGLGTSLCTPVKYMNGDLYNDGTLDPGTEWTFFCKTFVSSSGIHTAVATGTLGSVAVMSVPSSVNVFVAEVAPVNVHLHATPFPAVLHPGGGTSTIKYEVGNLSDTPVSDVRFSGIGCRLSQRVSGDENDNGVLDPNEDWTYVCTGEFSATEDFVVTFTGQSGGTVVTDTALVTIDVGDATPHPNIHLHVVANPARLPLHGGTAYLTYHVYNDGDVPLADVGLFSGSSSCIAPTYAGGDADEDGLLDLRERWDFVCVERIDETEAGAPVARGRAGAKWVSDNALFVIPVATEAPPAVDASTTGAYAPSLALAATPDIDTDLGLEQTPGFAACVIGVPYKVASDNDPRTQDDAAVYYCGRDGKRHLFASAGTYLSWYPDFSNVRIIASSVLSAIPMGDAVRSRPGSRLVKAAGDPKVYALSRGGVLRWIPNETVAKSLYGMSWTSKIDEISSATFVDRYRLGEPIGTAAQN